MKLNDMIILTELSFANKNWQNSYSLFLFIAPRIGGGGYIRGKIKGINK